MSDSVDRVFVHALNTVKKIPRTGSARPPSAERLKLYGLYKQSMEGDVAGVMARPDEEGERGSGEVEKWPEKEDHERSKRHHKPHTHICSRTTPTIPTAPPQSAPSPSSTNHSPPPSRDAWSAQHGLSRTAAKRRYISTLIATMHTYASATPDARALVAELEFVWDQIRANEAAGSDDSRPSPPQLEHAATARAEDPSPQRPGMRLLRPISSGDDASLDSVDKVEEEEEEEEGGVFDTGVGLRGSLEDRRPSGGDADYDVRNRKWRARMERAVVQLGAEVAALREGVEARRGWGEVLGGWRRKRGWWAFVTWLVWAVVRHVAVDAVLGLGVVAWVRRERVREVVGAWVREGRRRVREKG
ncbi:hypothetical protein MMC32_004274 [Xylographa parallela]|nr:hypothetical protein [Xylographa parallela]